MEPVPYATTGFFAVNLWFAVEPSIPLMGLKWLFSHTDSDMVAIGLPNQVQGCAKEGRGEGRKDVVPAQAAPRMLLHSTGMDWSCAAPAGPSTTTQEHTALLCHRCQAAHRAPMQVLIFLARSSKTDGPLLVGLISDGKDAVENPDEFVSVQTDGTTFAGPDNGTAIFTTDFLGVCGGVE